MDGKVEGTLNKKMKDFNETAPKVEVNLNPMVNNPMDANGDGVVCNDLRVRYPRT